MKKFILKFLSNRVAFLMALLIVVVVVMSNISPYFFVWDNLMTMTRFGAALALVGLGQSLVILAGGAGIDLSVGGMISLAGVFFGLMVGAGINVWVAAVLAVLSGGILGAVNGLTIAILGLPPLIGTLGTTYIYSALALVITKGIPISGIPKEFSFIANGEVLGLPTQIILIVLPVYILFLFLSQKTQFGRRIYLVGVNSVAAQFSGIQVKKVRFSLYVISGLLAGLASIILASWFMAARPDVGDGMDMQAITVAVLGGIDITGGVGNVVGTLLAVCIVTMINSGLQLANINTIWQLAILGIILLSAIAINQAIEKQLKGKN
jgi:ribose/xylose/arabinose/galactoside ABC-type transport system permease subunit